MRNKLVKNMIKYFLHRETGFTLIELLIVIAVLGILAAVIIPNISGFILSSKVAAANSEVLSLRTAIRAYEAENSVTYPTGTSDVFAADVSPYLSGPLKGAYTCSDTGVLTGTDNSYAAGITWDAGAQQWVRAP
jgi:prepilin-type N-terminal cleavage/methylation domain-containing protein